MRNGATTDLQPLPVGAVRPLGWLRERMQNDLRYGFVGRLDRLAPEQILEDDIYGADRLTRKVMRKDVGSQSAGAEWEIQFLWWNSESQSNWWDGYLRHVLLTGDEKLRRERLAPYIRQKLETADPDGYMGIYGADLRYRQQTENGELWAQASLFRGLLAWYEATGDEAVLDAVVRATEVTMTAWPIDASEPFRVKEALAGVGHGLMIVDVLDTLSRLTGQMRYRDYAVFLFDDYNRHLQPEADIQLKNLADPDCRFEGHGVHTYEHLRALVIAAFHTGRQVYLEALDSYLQKLVRVLTASGAPIGDEWVRGRDAHPSATGYEYCSLQELMHGYSLLLEKSGEAQWGDRMEWLFYNAAQGAGHPNGRAMAYVKCDNACQAMGHLHPDKPEREERNKYSPVHRDVAICCAPNAGRILPYFLQAMYHRTDCGVSIDLFGPSEALLEVERSKLRIRQQTEYPFDHTVSIEVSSSEAVCFELRIRVPAWAAGATVTGIDARRDGDWLRVSRTWRETTRFKVEFAWAARIVEHSSGMSAVAYGPLLFALPISHEEIAGHDYGEPGFNDIYARPCGAVDPGWRLSDDAVFEPVVRVQRVAPGFARLALQGLLYNASRGEEVKVELLPMGATVLRQLCFEKTGMAGESQE